jgi:hypothetical protein
VIGAERSINAKQITALKIGIGEALLGFYLVSFDPEDAELRERYPKCP